MLHDKGGIMKQYLMYLRKSRLDTDYEEVSVAETLSRHRVTLEKLCRTKRLHVAEVLEEVVSGESLSARPKMLRLLELVSTGMYAGVVCMDIERLSRGSSMESGYIMQILQVTNCQIITPSKVYDLQNESDEQFTDVQFLFSRFELRTSISGWCVAEISPHQRVNIWAPWPLMDTASSSSPGKRATA